MLPEETVDSELAGFCGSRSGLLSQPLSLFQSNIVTIKSPFLLQTKRTKAKSGSCHCEFWYDVRFPESFQVWAHQLWRRALTLLCTKAFADAPRTAVTTLFFLLLLIVCVTRSYDTITEKREPTLM